MMMITVMTEMVFEMVRVVIMMMEVIKILAPHN